MIQIKCDVGETSTLCEKGAKELLEIFDYYRDTFVNILVDEDQEVPEP